MWEYVFGGATIFGLIVAIGAWVNGRITRREISKLILEEQKATRELIAKMDERFAKMDERFESLLKALELHSKTSVQQHEEILRRI